MNVETLLAGRGGGTVRFALTGAGGGFGRTLLAQARHVPGLRASVLCDVDPAAARATAVEVGHDAERVRLCATATEVEAAAGAGDLAVVADGALLLPTAYDVLVEATGSPAAGTRMAAAALRAGRHVAVVSKEVESVSGVHLSALARESGVVCTPAGGDQPANLVSLVGWVRTLGLEVVAVGKSSEYDLVLDPATGVVTQLDQQVEAPGLRELMVLGDDVADTLARRDALLADLPAGATADYCEMAVVAAHTGYGVDVERMHLPVARPAELADVYALAEHGGLLRAPGVVDVFRALRTPEEASFAGGVFVVVRTHDPVTWELLRGKGHVVSRDGRYACLYLPYHLMGVETPMTLLAAARLGASAGSPTPGRSVVLAGRARRPLAAGAVLAMGGHHHDVEGVDAVLVDPAAHPGVAPLYLAAHARLARDVAPGELLDLDALEGVDPVLLDAWGAEVVGAGRGDDVRSVAERV